MVLGARTRSTSHGGSPGTDTKHDTTDREPSLPPESDPETHASCRRDGLLGASEYVLVESRLIISRCAPDLCFFAVRHERRNCEVPVSIALAENRAELV